MALIFVVLAGGCASKKVYPVIVRETVFVRDAPGVTTAQPNSGRPVSPTPGPTSAARAATPRPERGVTGNERGVTGNAAEVPATTGTVGVDGTSPDGSPGATAVPTQSPDDTPIDPVVSDRPVRAEISARRSGLLMVVWFAIAAALCGWGVLLRRDSVGRQRAHRTRRAA